MSPNPFEPIENLVVSPSISFELMHDNVQHAVSLGLPKITDNVAWREQNQIAIVGGGPSLANNLEQLRKHKYIMVCGSAHDYLMSQGIIPNWCVVCDPDELMNDYLQHKSLATDYLVASQCHAKVFEHLKHNKVFVWHAGGSDAENDLIKFPDGDVYLGGGCTVGTRAMVIALGFGFYNQTLYGFDTCLADDYKHHAYDFVNPEKETVGNIYEIKIGSPDSPTFKVAGYMLAQARDFQILCGIHKDKLNVKVVGGGFLAAIIECAEKEYLKRTEV